MRRALKKRQTGMDSCDYHLVLARDLDTTPRYLATGTAACMAANRLSYFFNLSGPSLTIDTACSSTMVALHQAVRALQCREIPMAVVCGAKLIINPDMFMPSSELGFLSPKGRCHSFDAAGDGYGRGEGVAAVLLKPLKTALLDGDPIRSVIKGTRVNQDGKTQGITLPSAEAQRRNMESLYKELNLSPDNIQYIEAHVCILSLLFREPKLQCTSNNELYLGHWNCCRRPAGVLGYQCSVRSC